MLVSISYAVNNPYGIIRTTLWGCLVPSSKVLLMRYESFAFILYSDVSLWLFDKIYETIYQ